MNARHPREIEIASVQGLGLRLDAVEKHYGPRRVLSHLDLHISPGQFVAIVGRSGCGKSTLLRLLAGLERPDGGTLRFDGVPPAYHRNAIRLMFQDARLLPWKRVADNVALGLGGGRTAARRTALEALEHVGLAERANEWPGRLSGGQRQRVALARALVHRPRLLLLDEPFGALDAFTRLEMHALLERLWQEEGFTAVLVTHDVSEAVALADRVILLDEGSVALDLPIEISRPRDRTEARFAELQRVILKRVMMN